MSPGQAKVKTTPIICEQQTVSVSNKMNQTAVNMTDRKNDHDFLRLRIEINLGSVKGFNLKVFYF